MISTPALQATPQVDTVVTVVARDGYDFVQALAAGSVAATFFGVLLIMLFSVIQIRKAARAIDHAKKQIRMDPAVESLRKTAGHLESVAKSFDVEAKKLAGSVTALSDRLTQVSDRMEERIEEFNALMEVVQAEAEGAFVEGASTARGVRAGIENLGSRVGRGGTHRRAAATEESSATGFESLEDRAGEGRVEAEPPPHESGGSDDHA